jgi:hypothetical protein
VDAAIRVMAASRRLDAADSLHAVSEFLGHANVTTTARYLNVKDDYLQELIERKPLALSSEIAHQVAQSRPGVGEVRSFVTFDDLMNRGASGNKICSILRKHRNSVYLVRRGTTLFAQRGLSAPTHCLPCRRLRRRERAEHGRAMPDRGTASHAAHWIENLRARTASPHTVDRD